MVVRKNATTGQRSDHGASERFGKLSNFRPGTSRDRAASGNDQRPLRGKQGGGRGLDALVVASDGGRLANGAILSKIDLRGENVLRDIDQHRPRLSGTRDCECLTEALDNEIWPIHPNAPLRDSGEDLDLINLLARPPVRVAGRATTGDDDHRQRAHEGFRNARYQVCCARPGGDATYARITGELRVPGSHARDMLLVAREDMGYLLLAVERVIDADGMATGHAEHELDSLGLEDIHDRLAGTHHRHCIHSSSWSPHPRHGARLRDASRRVDRFITCLNPRSPKDSLLDRADETHALPAPWRPRYRCPTCSWIRRVS